VLPAGGQGWNDLGFTTLRDGVVIHGHSYYGDIVGQLLLTGNGRLTWHAVRFRTDKGTTACGPHSDPDRCHDIQEVSSAGDG
jgi:hypothetical protein